MFFVLGYKFLFSYISLKFPKIRWKVPENFDLQPFSSGTFFLSQNQGENARRFRFIGGLTIFLKHIFFFHKIRGKCQKIPIYNHFIFLSKNHGGATAIVAIGPRQIGKPNLTS